MLYYQKLFSKMIFVLLRKNEKRYVNVATPTDSLNHFSLGEFNIIFSSENDRHIHCTINMRPSVLNVHNIVNKVIKIIHNANSNIKIFFKV